MTAVIVVEAVCIFLLGLLVVGLLQSHAEILRQLHELGAGRSTGREEAGTGPVAVDLAGGGSTGLPAKDLGGQTPGGEAAAVAVVGTPHDTLLAFLSSSCLTCAGFWDALKVTGDLGLPPHTRVLAVTKSPGDESESAVRGLASPARTVVMSTQAWLDYGVPGGPYFVHVNGPSGRVVGEGTATRWDQVVSLVTRAHEDRLAAPAGEPQRERDTRDRSRIDRDLMAAGILPGDRDLYPTAPTASTAPTAPSRPGDDR